MDRRQLLLAAVLSITCCVYAQQAQHTDIKVNGVKMNLHAPQANTGAQEPGALVQGPPTETATFIVGGKASNNKPPVMAEALVMPAAKANKPKSAAPKAMDDLKLTKEEKKKLFPCHDYKPYCSNYAKTGQCRDVWMQKNCRKSCNFCDIPYGVFIGCQDLDVCKKFAASACMVRWVRETCKSKCGQCGYERQANSHITMGKKRHFSDGNTKQSDQTKHVVKAKTLKNVLTKMTQKAKDTVKQATAKVKQQRKDDKSALKPKVAVVEKPVIKVKEAQSKDITEEEKDNSNDDDDDDDDDDVADDNNVNNDEDQDVSGEGSSQNEDEDNDDDQDKASGEARTKDKPDEPIRLDTDPRGEPVVTKLINQPIKFNDAPGKAMHVKHVKNKKHIKTVKDAQPKVEQQKKVAKKVENDQVEKKFKQVKKLQKSDKPKTTKPKKLKN
ncbi:AT-rich interactive domain-containing protein 4B-like isoform X2 [Orbicella faveolata]|uniref:AT-rich interactive domain-containing protein 4B-like isoform X2 n=1 Tax=Orbicella faveolata TaxID=48498 RepID=UPI0009E3372A|nr:AT-rich interactive domain-containing protein 4B-like isoform X2 [Orbicella faveolata]